MTDRFYLGLWKLSMAVAIVVFLWGFGVRFEPYSSVALGYLVTATPDHWWTRQKRSERDW